jgi:glycosyltransferase involved in cell wall biosynthesis
VSRRPRLLVLITLAEVGGAQSYVALLLPALVEAFDVTVAAHGEGPLADAARSAGARYVSLKHVRRSIHPWHDLRGLVELLRLCRKVRPDLVHANSSKAGVLGRLAAAVAGVPVRVFTVHGWAFAAYTGFASRVYLYADRLMRPLTTLVICVAENERAIGIAARTCLPEQTAVVHNAVDTAAFPQATHAGSPPRIVSVGRLKYPKDFATFVAALERLEVGSFRALVIGDGPDREALSAELARTGLGEIVELAGERGDVPDLLAASDIFVLSSRSEGLPVSILEAMAAGLPVVASAVGGVAELVEDGETGLLVPAGDADALAVALRRLVVDPELRQGLGAAGRRRAEAHFDLPAFREAHLGLFRRELARRDLPLPVRGGGQEPLAGSPF